MSEIAITPAKHQFFSPRRTLTIAGVTVTEMVRLKVLYVLLLFAFLVIGSSFFLGELTVQDQFQVLKDVSLGAMSIFTWLLGLLATAMMIPKDLEDRTLYTVLAKPVHRHEYLVGKLFGVLLILLLSILAMTAVFLIVLFLREQRALAEVQAAYANADPLELKAAVDGVKTAAFNWNLLPGIAIIYIKSSILATMTLLISTIASSWIFTVIMSVLVYFIGSLEGVARDVWQQSTSPLTRIFIGFVALIFPDLQLFNLTDDVVVGTAIPTVLFLKTAGLGGMYFVAYLLISQFLFATREL